MLLLFLLVFLIALFTRISKMSVKSHETQIEQSYEQKTKNGVGVFKLLAATVAYMAPN